MGGMMIRRFAAFAAALWLFAGAASAQQPVTAYPAPWNQVGDTVSLSATGSSSNVALGWVASGQGAPTTVWVWNSGTVDAYVRVGDSSVVAATTDVLVPAGAGATIALQRATYIAGITGGSSTTLSIATGTGSPLAKGGGAGGGGGGTVSSVFGRTGAVTAQSGDYTVGQVTGAAPSANPTFTGSLTATGLITLPDLATQATNTIVGNAAGGTASPTALAVGSCSTAGSALKWTTNTGFGCNTAIDAATLGGATFAAPGAIGGGTPGTGAFTTLSASSTVSGTGFSTYLASPPAIGGTAAAAGTFSAVNNTGANYVFKSGATTGTLSWSPATSNKTITLPNGTTDFTATGGASQVLQQTSAGGAFTVGRLACADLSNSGAGCTSGSPAWQFIGSATANNTSGVLSVGSIPGSYTYYMAQFEALVPGTNATTIIVQFGESGSAKTSGYHVTGNFSDSSATTQSGNANQNASQLFGTDGTLSSTSSNGGFNAWMLTANLGSSSQVKSAMAHSWNYNGTSLFRSTNFVVYAGDNNAITDIIATVSSGNIVSGTMTVWGANS